jgi:hypothetical protein
MKSIFYTFVVLLSSLFIHTSALAGPYDQPYAIISVEFIKSANDKIQPLILNRIDDQSTTRREEAVAPGKRLVVADLPSDRKKFERLATQKQMEIDAKACTRYYFAAKLTDLTTRRWELVNVRTETIGECQAKFFPAAAQAQTTQK